MLVLAPLVTAQRGAHRAVLDRVVKEGFVRARIDGRVTMVEDSVGLTPTRKHTIEVVVDRLTNKPEIKQRLADSVETPRLVVPAGLALYGARQLALGSGFGTGVRRGTQVEKYLAPVKRWLQDFF